ncbi:helix-turn-helix domain-containing protein [Micromonospora sp. CP22]|uniref:helix-turn-helix domain-containing protein n=1 Tax=Micromonospora sp. CP22 TaxID=2580517 RepID=UPI002815E29D|nr:helix-turn-helix domain-containing protein [Micromonospora sp. CP22]
MSRDPVPIGRRVAYLRVRRRMSQQSFADRLGKSKSWVDKVERGVRSLERVSTIRDIAAVLRVDVSTLLGRDAQPAEPVARSEGVARIRAALSTYDAALGRLARREPASNELAGAVAHAWTSYQHARYPYLIEQLPSLLADVQRAHAHEPEVARGTVVEAYRLTAALLVKLDEPGLAWLAADRAMSAATGDRVLVACAAIQLGQALRATPRARSILLAAAYRIAPRDFDTGTPEELSLCGSLLVQAALVAGRSGDERGAAELLDEAAELAARVGEGHDHHRTGFGPTAVEVARVAAAAAGDAGEAVLRHEKMMTRSGWRWLSVEQRAAHLIDAACAYLHVDEVGKAGHALTQADHIAPAEIRHRPTGREMVAQVARAPGAPATITQLAITLGVLRP